ncbi:MAG: hypothetical protein ACTSUE_21970 [Promethearchaeota archaeon]
MAKKGKTYKKTSHAWKYKHWSLIKGFIIFGAIVTIILSIYYMIPDRGYMFFNVTISTEIWMILWGVFHVFLAVVLLASTNAVNNKKLKIACDWWIVLLLGLIIILPTGNWGGLILVIASIIGLIDRL